jgi:hypothetical protein
MLRAISNVALAFLVIVGAGAPSAPAAEFTLPYTLSKPAENGPLPAVVILHD